MQNVKQHIVFKVLTFVLAITLLVPSAIKLAHAFENHKHEVCFGHQKTHLHTLDLECEFYKFKVNNTFTLSAFQIEFVLIENSYKVVTHEYNYSSLYQQLHFSLRAPPQLV